MGMAGWMKPKLFKNRNSDLKSYWKKGHMKADVILQGGRKGPVDWEWYQEKYKPNKSVKKAKGIFKRKDFKHKPMLKIQNRDKMTVWEYYKEIGKEAHREMVIQN